MQCIGYNISATSHIPLRRHILRYCIRDIRAFFYSFSISQINNIRIVTVGFRQAIVLLIFIMHQTEFLQESFFLFRRCKVAVIHSHTTLTDNIEHDGTLMRIYLWALLLPFILYFLLVNLCLVFNSLSLFGTVNSIQSIVYIALDSINQTRIFTELSLPIFNELDIVT